MTEQDLETLNALIQEHSKTQRVYLGYSTSPAERVRTIVEHYRSTATQALENMKRHRDDEVVYLRAMAMILEMVGNASTHREKAARLRGCIELIESGITRLREMDFEIARTYHWMPDLFRSDYPVRKYMDELSELKRELEELKKPKQPATPATEDGVPF